MLCHALNGAKMPGFAAKLAQFFGRMAIVSATTALQQPTCCRETTLVDRGVGALCFADQIVALAAGCVHKAICAFVRFG